MEKCTCFDDMLKALKDHIETNLPSGATELKVSWENMAYHRLSEDDYSQVNPRVNISYRQQKRDGTPAKNLTKDTVAIFCNYCPFCGRKYGKENNEE